MARPSALDRLSAAAKPVHAKQGERTAPAHTITLTDAEAELLDRLCGAGAVLKVAGAGLAETKEKLISFLAAAFRRLCVEGGKCEENPAVITDRSRAGLQVKHVSGIKVEYDEADNLIPVAEQLRDAGFTDEVIAEIQEKAIRTKSSLRMRSLTELKDSANAADQKLARKIALLIERELTDPERELLLENRIDTTVDECWKGLSVAIAVRVSGGDAEKGAEVLGKLWEVLPVQFVLAQLSFGGEVAEAFGKLMAGS